MAKPKANNTPESKPKLGQQPLDNFDSFLTFSFRFFDQRKYFGITEAKENSLKNLIIRLSELSKRKLSELERMKQEKGLRFHQINWQQEKIPIQRKDLDWLPNEYLENDDEYPIMQLSISTALGRFAGFFDENNVFNIVLLDFQHNLQPSKSFGYKVDTTTIFKCDYSSTISRINNLLEKKEDEIGKEQVENIKFELESETPSHVYFVSIGSDYCTYIQENQINLSHIIELGVAAHNISEEEE
jgi:hypothetical protein